MYKYAKVFFAVVVAFVLLLVSLNFLASQKGASSQLIYTEGRKRLTVLVHGMPGRTEFEPVVALTREALPDSDLLVFEFDSGVLSNSSPYAIANRIERDIHQAYANQAYDEIILVGHSMGGMLLRKALVWGNGLEEQGRRMKWAGGI